MGKIIALLIWIGTAALIINWVNASGRYEGATAVHMLMVSGTFITGCLFFILGDAVQVLKRIDAKLGKIASASAEKNKENQEVPKAE